jgi:type II secretory pathway pseudopilin PulG
LTNAILNWTTTMDVQKKRAPLKIRKPNGFTMVEITVMAAIISIVTAFGLIGITRARASVRLSGAAREYANYIEKARMHSIRSHADEEVERGSVAIAETKTSYNVTMDLDGDGSMDLRTVDLPEGVSFDTVETIAFDWRGRTWSTVDDVTTANAQVSIRLVNSNGSVSVDVTGSGDITIDSQVFDDSVPNVSLRVGDLASGGTPEPTPEAIATPTPEATPTPSLGDGLPVPTPTIPIGDGGVAVPTPTPSNSGSGSGSSGSGSGSSGSGSGSSGSGSGRQPTPTPTPTPTPSPTPAPCTITTDPANLSLSLDRTTTIKVSHNGNSSISITGTSSKASDLQITPGGPQTVGAGSAATFTIKSKKSIGVYNITFSSGCGSKVVPVIVLL